MSSETSIIRPSSLKFEKYSSFWKIHEPGTFFVDANTVAPHPDEAALLALQRLLFKLADLHTRARVLDLGSNTGFRSFQALFLGAENVEGIDSRADLIGACNSVAQDLGLKGISFFESRLDMSTLRGRKANVVYASFPASLTALGSAVCEPNSRALLAALTVVTQDVLVLEWASSEDVEHGSAESGIVSVEVLMKALEEDFESVEKFGDLSTTRALIVARRKTTHNRISAFFPVELRRLGGEILSARLLADCEGELCWSAVIDGGDHIVKVTNPRRVSSEVEIYRTLAKSHYFPKLLEDARPFESLAAFKIEKIGGESLEAAYSALRDHSQRLTFVRHCLELVGVLEDHNIQHRDIHSGNLIVRQGLPVLFDFGWATRSSQKDWAPLGLGLQHRPPDRSFSDSYSMASLLQTLSLPPACEFVLALMTSPHPGQRLPTARQALTMIGDLESKPQLASSLANYLSHLKTRVDQLRSDVSSLEKRVPEARQNQVVLRDNLQLRAVNGDLRRQIRKMKELTHSPENPVRRGEQPTALLKKLGALIRRGSGKLLAKRF
jgi:hypothetical protein